jgi:hypothetical protein
MSSSADNSQANFHVHYYNIYIKPVYIEDNMFYGVTVLEGEAKRECSLDLGRGKYNESN